MLNVLTGDPLSPPPVENLRAALERIVGDATPWLTVHTGNARESVTGSTLLRLALCWARALQEADVEPGDRVALLLPNHVSFAASFFGCQLIGAVPVPLAWPVSLLDVRRTVSVLKPLVDDAGAKVLITTPAVAAIDPFGRPTVVAPSAAPARALVWPSGDDPAFIQYTSGSLGRPRGEIGVPGDCVRRFEVHCAVAVVVDVVADLDGVGVHRVVGVVAVRATAEAVPVTVDRRVSVLRRFARATGEEEEEEGQACLHGHSGVGGEAGPTGCRCSGWRWNEESVEGWMRPGSNRVRYPCADTWHRTCFPSAPSESKMPRPLCLLPLTMLLACAAPSPTPPTTAIVMPVAAPAAAPARPKSDAEKTVLDIALGSPDHTTLVAGVKATDLAVALGSPGGIYTVFAPTNAAFDKLPAGTLDELLKPENKAKLKKIIQHHAAVPIMNIADLKDGAVIGMSDGTNVTVHVTGETVMIDGATIVGTVRGMNGVVHVVDTVILPAGG